MPDRRFEAVSSSFSRGRHGRVIFCVAVPATAKQCRTGASKRFLHRLAAAGTAAIVAQRRTGDG